MLAFDEPLADYLVDGRLDAPRCSGLPMPMAVTVIHDEVPVVVQVDDELLQFAEEFGFFGAGLSVRSHLRLSNRCNAG